MGVDHVDLIQLHNLVEPGEWEVALGPTVRVEALAAARDEGLVRFIGVTGHGTRIAAMHLRSLERFPFDSVLFPYNRALVRDPAYGADVARLRSVCNEGGVAMQTIKSIARRRWDDPAAPHHSWYEPLTDPDAIARAVRYVLAEADLFLNSTSDATLLPAVLSAAAGHLDAPGDEVVDDDIDTFGIRPLFDGAGLERIELA